MAVKRLSRGPAREMPPSKNLGGKGGVPKGSPRPPGAGRKKGSPNKITTDLREASLLAAIWHGKDGKGTDKLVGYMFQLARDYPQTFCREFLGKMLPAMVTAQVSTTVTQTQGPNGPKTYTREEVISQLADRGININAINLDKSEYKALENKAFPYRNGNGNGSSNGKSSGGSQE